MTTTFNSNPVEVWADLSLDPPYILILRNNGEEDGEVYFSVYDPQASSWLKYGTYTELSTWLMEDDYEPVVGRAL